MYLLGMQVLSDLLLQQPYDRVIYAGDGANDYCPSQQLGAADVLLAREAYPDGRLTGLYKQLQRRSSALASSDDITVTLAATLQSEVSWWSASSQFTGMLRQLLLSWADAAADEM